MKKQGWQYSKDEKLIMELWVFWGNNRKQDTHNLHKLIADAFEKVLYENDKMVLMRDMDFEVDKGNPRVEIVVRGTDNLNENHKRS